MVKDGQLAVLRTLVDVSSVDLMYADLYLHRATELLSEVLTRDDYARVGAERRELPRLAEELRRAAERAEWGQVKTLAAAATMDQEHVATQGALLDVADAVYGPRLLNIGPTALALAGLAPYAQLERERAALAARFAWLESADPQWSRLYGRRARVYRASGPVHAGNDPGTVDEQALRSRVLDAVARGDFTAIARLVDGVAHPTAEGQTARVALPPAGYGRAIAEEIPPAAVARAERYGFVVETLPADPCWEGYLAGDGGDPSATCSAMRETLDLLLGSPFMTSGGSRYLPWFGEERLLIETFPETQPEGGTALLERLGLPRRCGLSRLALEDAVRSHSVDLCIELGLDPLEFTLAPIPFDAYVRLAPRYSWGTHAIWTHFDGYQVVTGTRLRALVGGDVRYGGVGDLCAVQRDYDALRITTRLSIVRRVRFAVRAPASS
jgi:hypothetical protein